MTSRQPQRMECMEVWGGNRAADAGVAMPGLDVWVYCRPYGDSVSGGDVHYVSSCASGRITRLLLADVTGHGEPVSEIAVGLRTIMRRHINIIDQTTVVQAINDEFKHLHDVGMMATAIAGTFFLPKRTLTLSNAGHPPALVYRRKAGSWEALERRDRQPRTGRENGPSNVPLGLLTDARWEKVEVPLHSGDLVLLFTDSLIEIPVDDDEPLWIDGLLEIVRTLDPDRPAELISTLLAAIKKRAQGAPFDDDTSVLLLRANGTRTRWLDDFLAPFRYLADLVRLRRAGQPS